MSRGKDRRKTSAERVAEQTTKLAEFEIDLADAEKDAARTLQDRLRTPILFAIGSAVSIAVGATGTVLSFTRFAATNNAVTLEFAGESMVFALIGIVVGLFTVSAIRDALYLHRGEAAEIVDECAADIAATRKRISLYAGIVEAEHAYAEIKAARKRTRPTRQQLLNMIIASSSRTVDDIVSDSVMWSRVAANPSDEGAWADLAEAGGWDRALTAKVRAAAAVRADRAAAPHHR